MYLHFYVYAYLRKSNHSPYYIGKGSGKRAWDKRHNVSVPKNPNQIVILESNLSEVGALAIERRMIRWYGRKDLNTGILHNKTDGGDGTSGWIPTPEQRKQRSVRAMGNQNGKFLIVTEEMRIARSQRALGNKNALGGKSKTGQKLSDHTKRLIGDKRRGARWWNNGVETRICKNCPGPEWHQGRIT